METLLTRLFGAAALGSLATGIIGELDATTSLHQVSSAVYLVGGILAGGLSLVIARLDRLTASVKAAAASANGDSQMHDPVPADTKPDPWVTLKS